MEYNAFAHRHIGPREKDVKQMTDVINVSSVDELINQTIPSQIRLQARLILEEGMSEFEYAKHINELADQNDVKKSFIGQGYYGTIIPAPIQRNILENPGWYTAYTPYQAEISQGRLEALLNYQTTVSDLTGLPMANASLLDESTAAAEAMIMLFNARPRAVAKAGVSKFFVSDQVYRQTLAVMQTRANPLGIELIVGDEQSFEPSNEYYGMMLQYPTISGTVNDYKALVSKANAVDCKVVVATDLLALTLLEAPGNWGVDVAVGSTQRFGVPMGFGGPHAGFFATKEDYKRQIPGRIIGVSVDMYGNPALRMALQTREQHIKRDRATSNICTAQALLAIMAGTYAVYHGAEGLKSIASQVNGHANSLSKGLKALGLTTNENYFDTLSFNADGREADFQAASEAAGVNFGYANGQVIIACDETTITSEVQTALDAIASVLGKDTVQVAAGTTTIPAFAKRTSDFLTHDVFNSHHSETQLMRYLKSLENKDVSLTHSMISLGSCTMKLNAASQLYPITNPKFASLHPFTPKVQVPGIITMIDELERILCTITGFDAMSFQPNSGAQGEYAGLLAIKQYHEANNDFDRTIALIPASAHGTNPASAVMAGMKVVVVKCDEKGEIDMTDLKEKVEKHQDTLCALMVTYPSTHGVFEDSIMEVTNLIHENGGLVYMDGANMNAQVGLTNPASIGADVCHLNLHKTFAIPHGGGGPGVGPIGVNNKLKPFLSGHPITSHDKPAVSGAEYGSALILLISYSYCKMLGLSGLEQSTKTAILNANYMKDELAKDYDILYVGDNGRVAHEMILDCRSFKKEAGVEVADIAKRLIDYGFHAPTVSFPVAGTLMVEPTESESKEEIDRFITAMKSIRAEIQEIADGKASATDNVLINAPHTAKEVCATDWKHDYSREKAAYPVSTLVDHKYWVPVARVDNAHGDRNLICTCPSIEEYADENEGAMA